MKFCSNCGAEVKEGQAICLSCGFALKESAVKADPASNKDYSDRVEHDVFKLWPAFSDGPIGRMEYFKKFLILTAVGMGVTFLGALIIGGANSSNPPMMIMSTLFILVAFAVMVILVAHQIALLYKRFWDMGITDAGGRIGMIVVYVIISAIPLLNLATLAMFFIPGKGKQS